MCILSQWAGNLNADIKIKNVKLIKIGRDNSEYMFVDIGDMPKRATSIIDKGNELR